MKSVVLFSFFFFFFFFFCCLHVVLQFVFNKRAHVAVAQLCANHVQHICVACCNIGKGTFFPQLHDTNNDNDNNNDIEGCCLSSVP